MMTGENKPSPHAKKHKASQQLLSNESTLQATRKLWIPTRPQVLKGPFRVVDTISPGPGHTPSKVEQAFPHLKGGSAVELVRCVDEANTNGSCHEASNSSSIGAHAGPRSLCIGIVLSGGQAPGGHNVLAGLLDFLLERHPGSRLIGFKDGPKGILTKSCMDITEANMAAFRNTGGFNMVGSGRDKIESEEDLRKAASVAQELALDGLVVAGGDDSNTNAAVLANFFLAAGLKTCVIGVPKTIDGDLKHTAVPTSFGFDTACKVYSEMIGNLIIDSASTKRYWHVVRLMGRAASHITLEAALQTHPQAAIISEEVHARGQTLAEIVSELADVVAARAAAGRSYGVVLLPEGLIEHIQEIGALLAELNELLAGGDVDRSNHEGIAAQLSPAARATFGFLPQQLRRELLLDRDPHGNVQVARIETEKLLLQLLEAELESRRGEGKFGGKFAGLTHYFGYEGRCSMPTNFDATYCAALGYAAGALIGAGRTGLMATCGALERPATDWAVGGFPLMNMMCVERRKGKDKPVIRKALVDLQGPAFAALAQHRARWALEDAFRSPGPIQFAGPGADAANFTLALEVNGGAPIHI